MADIPESLRNKKFRFVRIKKGDKAPLDADWPNTGNYGHADEFLQAHIQDGGNYGVLTGHGLVVIDCDDPELIEVVKEKLPGTFTVRTGSDNRHFYYRCDLEKKIILNKGDKHVGEVQAKGQQVVGPTSVHLNGKLYEVIDDSPIAELNAAELKAALSDYLPEESERPKDSTGYDNDPVCELIKSRLKVKDLLAHYGVDTKRNPCMCPLGHDSRGGKCFSFKEDVWHCFHCEKSGNIFHLIQEREGVEFREAYKLAAKLAGIDVGQLAQVIEIVDKQGNVISDEVAAEKIHQILLRNLALAETSRDKQRVKFEAMVTIVNHLIGKHTFKSVLNGSTVEYWIYRDGIYVESGQEVIRTFTEMAFGDLTTNHLVQEVAGHVHRRTIVTDFKGEDRRYICVKNGIYDLEESILMPHTPDKIFFNKLPVEYVQGADCPAIKKFLNEVLAPNDVLVAQEVMGYCLRRDYVFQNVFFLSGSGANGKTVVSKLFKGLLGEENISSVSMQQIAGNRFMMIQLRNKLININPDISDKALENISIIKALTGGDLVTGENKGQDPIKFTNYAKLVFGANQLPRVADDTDAWFRRVLILNFVNRYLPEVDYEAHKKEANVFLADPHLETKLLTESELSGLLNFALEGLQRLLKQGHFSNPKTLETRKKEFLFKSDNFRIFCDECIEQGNYTDYISKQEFRKEYLQWCKDNEVNNPVSENVVKTTLFDRYGVGVSRKGVPGGPGDDRPRCWTGIKLRGEASKSSKPGTPGTPNDQKIQAIHPVHDYPSTRTSFEENKQSRLENKESMDTMPTVVRVDDKESMDTLDAPDDADDDFDVPEPPKRPFIHYSE